MVLATPSNSAGRGAADGRAPGSSDPAAVAGQPEEVAEQAPGTPIKLVICGGTLLIAALSIGTAWFVFNARARAGRYRT
jgi:hypothetical protein